MLAYLIVESNLRELYFLLIKKGKCYVPAVYGIVVFTWVTSKSTKFPERFMVSVLLNFQFDYDTFEF